MRILSGSAAANHVTKLSRRSSQFSAVEPAVRSIVEDVRKGGDKSLRKYATRWDGLTGPQLKISEKEMQSAWKSASPLLRSSLKKAAKNIREFCEWQKPKSWTARFGRNFHWTSNSSVGIRGMLRSRSGAIR